MRLTAVGGAVGQSTARTFRRSFGRSEIMSEVCDSDAPGVNLDFETFCKSLGPVLQNTSVDELDKRAFEAMDADGSGTIDAKELAPLMSLVAGQRMTNAQAEEVLALSAGSDGKVRFEHFRKAVADE